MRHRSRGPRALLVLVGLLALAACGSTAREEIGVTRSATTVCAGTATTNGLDVSHYDGTIDWSMVQASGRAFAFARATDGTSYVDPTFAANWSGMKQAGVIRGAYHFFEPGMDPVAQATFFVQTMGALAADDLPPALDFEVAGTDAGAAAADALTFLTTVESLTGRRPIVYASATFVNSSLANPAWLEGYSAWVANWSVSCPNVPAPWTSWTFWQSSDTGSVPGAQTGPVTDLDVFDGSLADLQTFVAGSLVDAGAPGDGGGTGDGGSDAVALDAGAADDGSGNGPEAGSGSDASGLEAGTPEVPDSAATVEGGALADAPDDANPGAGAGKSGGGCSCRTAGTDATGSTSAWLAIGAFAALGALRRRRLSS